MPAGIALFQDPPKMVSGMVPDWKEVFSFPMDHVFTCETTFVLSSVYLWLTSLCLLLCSLFQTESHVYFWDMYFHSKSYFFHKPTISDQEWMKPVIFDECLFKLIPHVIIVSFALSLHFSSLFYSWMIFVMFCQTQDYMDFLGRNFSFTQLWSEHCIFIYVI